MLRTMNHELASYGFGLLQIETCISTFSQILCGLIATCFPRFLLLVGTFSTTLLASQTQLTTLHGCPFWLQILPRNPMSLALRICSPGASDLKTLDPIGFSPSGATSG